MIVHFSKEDFVSEIKLTFELRVIPTETITDVERIILECIGTDHHIRFEWDAFKIVRLGKILLQLFYLQVTYGKDHVFIILKIRSGNFISFTARGFENWVIDCLGNHQLLPPGQFLKLMKVVKKDLVHVTARVLNASM